MSDNITDLQKARKKYLEHLSMRDIQSAPNDYIIELKKRNGELEEMIQEMDSVLVGTYQYCERCKYLNGHVSDILEKYHGKPIEEIIK